METALRCAAQIDPAGFHSRIHCRNGSRSRSTRHVGGSSNLRIVRRRAQQCRRAAGAAVRAYRTRPRRSARLPCRACVPGKPDRKINAELRESTFKPLQQPQAEDGRRQGCQLAHRRIRCLLRSRQCRRHWISRPESPGIISSSASRTPAEALAPGHCDSHYRDPHGWRFPVPSKHGWDGRVASRPRCDTRLAARIRWQWRTAARRRSWRRSPACWRCPQPRTFAER